MKRKIDNLINFNCLFDIFALRKRHSNAQMILNDFKVTLEGHIALSTLAFEHPGRNSK